MSNNFSISLAAARVNAGMSQADVASKLRISKVTLGNWERGKTTPSLSDIMALSNLYKVPMNYIHLP